MVISILATLLMHKLIQAGNLINVTNLFYLVPGVTAIMDYLFLGNALPLLSLIKTATADVPDACPPADTRRQAGARGACLWPSQA